MRAIHTVPTPNGTVTIVSGEDDAGTEPYVYQEGPATVLRVGRFEIAVDPEAVAPDVQPACNPTRS